MNEKQLQQRLTEIWEKATDRNAAWAVLLAHPEVTTLIGEVIGDAMLGAYELGTQEREQCPGG